MDIVNSYLIRLVPIFVVIAIVCLVLLIRNTIKEQFMKGHFKIGIPHLLGIMVLIFLGTTKIPIVLTIRAIIT